MIDFLMNFVLSNIILAISIIYSFCHIFVEKNRNIIKKIFILYILFFIFYSIFFILYLNFLPIEKDISDSLIIFSIVLFILSFMVFSIVLDKFFTFNDVNLLFGINIIVFMMANTVGCKIGYCPREVGYYIILFYSIFLLTIYYILFFINMVIQSKNSEKRKKQSQSDGASSEEDSL